MYPVFVRRGCLVAVALFASFSLVAPAYANVADGEFVGSSGPAAIYNADQEAFALGMSIRERALKSSFEELESFAEAALQRRDVEGLRQLQYVTTLYIGQREYAAAESWNRSLHAAAKRRQNPRYISAAEVNDVAILFARDRNVRVADVERLVARQTDWLPKALAQILLAKIYMAEFKYAEALAVLNDIVTVIPEERAGEAGLAPMIWDNIAYVHAYLDDVPGFFTAVRASERLKSKSEYPRPDFEALYMLAQTMGFVGRYAEAQGAVTLYQELAERSGTKMHRAMAGNICGYVAALRDDWREVLKCYAPFGSNLDVTENVRLYMLPRRATAYARTGQIALAERDLRELREGVALGKSFDKSSIERAEAEYLVATGDYVRGVKALRDYHLVQYRRMVQRVSVLMDQVVLGLDDQLQQAREQADLKNQTIMNQRWLVGLGALVGLIFAIMFLHQRKLSRQLSTMNAELKRKRERQAELFVNLSHEIRTPLNGVVAMADALGHTELSPEAAKMARIISASSDTLERLLSDILDSAKMEAGQLAIEVAPFDLEQTLTYLAAFWRPRANEKGIKIVMQIGDGARRYAVGDKVRLLQVLNNLIGNALKFTDKGKIVISVMEQSGDRILFAVTDTGVGFSNEFKARLFNRFSQEDSTITRRYGGTGLGLPISRELVRMMGGELDCQSVDAFGAQFWFDIELPRVAGSHMASAGGAGYDAATRFLIVDDNATNRTILGMLLKGDDRQLYYAENGKEAVELAQTLRFDVILMDMQMPVMSGVEAIGAIRAYEAKAGSLPSAIVVLSANADSHHQKQGADAGSDGHIAKPIVLERLLEGIDQAMQYRSTLNKNHPSRDVQAS